MLPMILRRLSTLLSVGVTILSVVYREAVILMTSHLHSYVKFILLIFFLNKSLKYVDI